MKQWRQMKTFHVNELLLDKYLSEARKYFTWKLGNDCLYSLCKNNPQHKRVDEVVAKLWLIGRSYAAALERRKNKRKNDQEFYEFIAAPAIIESELDAKLKSLGKFSSISEDSLQTITEVHGYLTGLFYRLTNQYKVSLASKYLHFHFPKHFFLLDSRALKGLRLLAKGMRVSINFQDDYWYGHFSAKLIKICQYINDKWCIHLTAREIDTLLLMIADNEKSTSN